MQQQQPNAISFLTYSKISSGCPSTALCQYIDLSQPIMHHEWLQLSPYFYHITTCFRGAATIGGCSPTIMSAPGRFRLRAVYLSVSSWTTLFLLPLDSEVACIYIIHACSCSHLLSSILLSLTFSRSAGGHVPVIYSQTLNTLGGLETFLRCYPFHRFWRLMIFTNQSTL